MGCPKTVFLNDDLTFGICCHDPDTGVLTDADSLPVFRVYEDENATPIAGGDMAKLDDTNTTGFYTATIACSARNGYKIGKSYTIYIEATVDSDTGGMCYAFKVAFSPWSNVILDGINAPDGKHVYVQGRLRYR